MGNTEKRNELPHFKAVTANEVNTDEEKEGIKLTKEKGTTDNKESVNLIKEEETAVNTAVSLKKETDNSTADPQETKAQTEAAAEIVSDSISDVKDEDKPDNGNKNEGGDDEVVFAGGELPAAPHSTGNDNNADEKDSSDESDDEGSVVFAVQSKTPKKTRIARAKRRSPLIPVISVAAVLCAAAAAGIIVWAMNNNSSPAIAETSASSDTSEGSDGSASGPSDGQSGGTSENSLVSVEPVEISEIDTTNILFGENVTVEGVDLAGKSLTQAHEAMQEKLLELRDNISITIVCDGKTLTLTQNDFNFDSDIADVLLQAYHYSRGELHEPTVENSYNGSTTNFRVHTSINTESVETAINKAAEFYDVQPVDAHVTKFDPTATQKFEYADGSDGFLLDHEELGSKIRSILDQGEKTGSFSIDRHQTPFKISLEEIKANTRLIASHRTTAANVYASNSNMKLAIRSANGTILQPGETFSFNATTGDTTNGNMHYYPYGVEGSYVPSTAYSQGKIVQEYGGGICQASTTLFMCALKANMEIVERHAHLYASSYAPYGLDATVDYGNLDMRFKNNYELPVYIATYVYDYTGDGNEELMVEMYGPLSEEYDEIVPVGWVTYADNESFSARGAKVYFKNGKETDRVKTPLGAYDYHFEGYYTVINYMPSDVYFGPDAYPTGDIPTVYSPGGCGENGPIAYGTASEVLSKARASGNTQTQQSQTESSGPSGTVVTTA